MHLNAAEVEKFRSRTQLSKKLWERTKEVIPSGHGGGMGYFLPYPIMVDHAKGCWLWDVDGNRYLELRIGDWVLIHGHCDDDIRDAVVRQLERSVQIGGPEWDLGYRMASLLVDRVPSVDKVRFFASGTDANLCAIRLARGFTGRTMIAKAMGSYHGTADALIVGHSILRPPGDVLPPGVAAHAIDEVVEFAFNDLPATEEVLRQHGSHLAAVLVEPVMTAAGMIEADGDYLRGLRSITAELGIVLIFDEVVTFPVAYGGGQAHFGVTPDLTTMGKAIGGGLPVSAVGGRADIMDLLEPDAHGGVAPISVLATFGGNQLGMAAGIACLEKLTPQTQDRVSAWGATVRQRINDLGRTYGIGLHATGLGHLIGIHWADERVTGYQTRLRDDREKVININLALDNDGFYQTFTGVFQLSTAIGESEVEDFLAAVERALHTLGYVS